MKMKKRQSVLVVVFSSPNAGNRLLVIIFTATAFVNHLEEHSAGVTGSWVQFPAGGPQAAFFTTVRFRLGFKIINSDTGKFAFY